MTRSPLTPDGEPKDTATSQRSGGRCDRRPSHSPCPATESSPPAAPAPPAAPRGPTERETTAARNPFELFLRLRAVPSCSALSDDELLDLFQVYPERDEEFGLARPHVLLRSVLRKAMSALGKTSLQRMADERKTEQAAERRSGSTGPERRARAVAFHTEFVKLAVSELKSLSYVPRAFPINLHNRQDLVHVLNFLIGQWEAQREKKPPVARKLPPRGLAGQSDASTPVTRKQPAARGDSKFVSVETPLRALRKQRGPVSPTVSRFSSPADNERTPAVRKTRAPVRKLTPDSPWHSGTDLASQSVPSAKRDALESNATKSLCTPRAAGVRVSPFCQSAERNMEQTIDEQRTMISRLVDENKRLSVELEEVHSMFERLIRESPAHPEANRKTEREDVDDRRIKLLQSVNIQLERQVLAQAEAIQSRAGLVDEVSATVEDVLQSLKEYAEHNTDPSVSSACELMSRMNARLQRQLPLWKSAGIMASSASDECGLDSAERFSRNLHFGGLFVDPARTARRRKLMQPSASIEAPREVGSVATVEADVPATAANAGGLNQEVSEVLERDRPRNPVKLLDICSGKTEHLNLRMVAMLESRLRSLYGRLRMAAAELQHIRTSSGFRGNIDRIVAETSELQRELDAVADLLFRVSVLVPASPFVSTGAEAVVTVRGAPNKAEGTSREHAVLELPSVDDVLGRLPQFTAGQRRKLEKVLGVLFRGWRSYQEMYTLEISSLRSVLASVPAPAS